MTTRRTTISTLPTTAGGALEVELRYEMGGSGLFGGTSSARGYYLAVNPVTYTGAGDVTFRSYRLFSGVKLLLAEAARYSAKELARLVADVDGLQPKIDELVSYVCSKENIALAGPVPEGCK